jgi:hypothetical protein
MRSVAEYLARAAEFDDMAHATSAPALQKRYLDIAECYRLLARNRHQLVAAGAIEPESALAEFPLPHAQAGDRYREQGDEPDTCNGFDARLAGQAGHGRRRRYA